jgi:hypothetical protein
MWLAEKPPPIIAAIRRNAPCPRAAFDAQAVSFPSTLDYSKQPGAGRMRRQLETLAGMPMISHVLLLQAILRMVAAVLVGCVVGLDRNLRGKPTGVKTLGTRKSFRYCASSAVARSGFQRLTMCAVDKPCCSTIRVARVEYDWAPRASESESSPDLNPEHRHRLFQHSRLFVE